MRTLSLVVLLAIVLPAACLGEERCPWLNAATAGGILGGEVTSISLKLSRGGDAGDCLFTRGAGALWHRLFVSVEVLNSAQDRTAYAAHCASQKTSLKAIGNEAVACTYESGGPGEIGEQVSGRVRNQAFLIRVSTTDRAASASALRESAQKIAEEVAGAMF